ncbi:hypothetical protein IQ13_1849 [Lacibacter cauensis]|uniref:Uncharacterized protein n=1 Tax=Lacibacter cauensis TaxID=510947 RepID=A0A562SR46_9BACT|nr:hypothetical protein [Lacibacter cauensis]TWI83735.1 hypothetical protein IQ13_1849 [Lacibacter cauensis]
MKRFKQIEFYSSVLLIIGFFISWLISRDNSQLLTAYFVVGAVHIVGMLVHAANKWFTNRSSLRLYYHWLIAILILLVPFGFGLFILLYTAPVLALIYTIICKLELNALELKELVHLK